MLSTSRLIWIGSLLSLVAAGCGGGSSTKSGPDASSQPDSGGTGPNGDGAVGTDDGSVTAEDATTGDGSSAEAGVAPDGSVCSANGDCQNAHCVSGICCASACTSPASCQTATGATCSGGSTCVYPTASDGTACDDGDACTMTDTCTAGTCVGSGAVSCDDGNVCTTDSCVSPTGCVHDGTGVVTAGCMAADMCNTYHCQGDKAGTCAATSMVDCSASTDQCNTGVCDGATGACTKQAANDAQACDDMNACTVGEVCTSGTCGGGSALDCNDSNPCTDDSCDAVLGCENQNNTATCDDGNPCTVNDTCSVGQCAGSPMNCSSFTNACNTGVCTGGACAASPVANNTACDDSNACTTTDVCTNGTCTGSGNSCGANSTACTAGPPKVCTCAAGYVSTNGQCVLQTSGCAANPCVAGATCTEPSTTVVCTCPTGYTGDGTTAGTGCTLINNCANNPCGAGLGTCVNGVNTHTCNCNQGYVSVNGACVCDMNGTFASQVSLTSTWSGITFFENGTNVPSTQWALRTQTYDSSGNLVIQTTQCGGTTIDLCGQSIPTITPNEAYAQYIPGPVYGTTYMPTTSLSIVLTNTLPGQAYTEPQSAFLLGISLTDPLGAWPAAAANIGAGANQTNGAIWVDNDNDKFEGVTSYAVPPGGIASTTAPMPIESYGAQSLVCPRGNDAGARLSYNYVPGLDGLSVVRVKRLYTASRTISSLSGTISTCDTSGVELVQGTVGGPDNGQLHSDGRVGGCVEVSGSGEANCSSSTASDYDGENQSEHVTSGSFILKRVPSGTTCATVRTLSFP